MQNGYDLSHINKQLQGHKVDIEYARRQVNNQRMMADQMHRDGDLSRANYYEQEADRFERQATELEDEMDELQTAKERTEKRIAELVDQRGRVNAEHTDRLSQIDRELTQLRGSGMML